MRSAMLILALALSAACGGTAGAGPAGGPSDETGGGVGPGPASAGQPTVSFERLDGSGDCAGVVPDRAPAPLILEGAAPDGSVCTGGTSDGTGAIALGARDASGATTWRVYGRDGAPRRSFEADPPLLPQPSGWHAAVASGPQGASDTKVEVVAFAPDGSATRRQTASPDPSQAVYIRWNLARDPAGGSVAALRSSALAGNHFSSVSAQRFDVSGAPAWPDGGVRVRVVPSATEPLFLAGGVSTRGELLVLSQRSAALDVSWLDPQSGAPLPDASMERAEPFADVVGAGLDPAIELHPLLDASVAVRADGTFRRVYRRLATSSSPLPAWLAERTDATFRFTRGNAAYAVLPPPGLPSADCSQRIELVSPGGRLCGRVVLRGDGRSCTTGAVDQGWDGTVVQQASKDSCVHRAWPRLLAR